MGNGKQRAEVNLAAFTAWAAGRSDADFRELAVRGQLNRQRIAQACGFARSVLDQNPRVREALRHLEASLCDRNVLTRAAGAGAARSDASRNVQDLSTPASVLDASTKQPSATEYASDKQLQLAQRRAMALEQQNAALVAENYELRRQLREAKQLAERVDVMLTTGRRVAAPPKRT